MLRFDRRWHDAANGPLHGEARLLWFSAKKSNPPNNGFPPGNNPDDEDDDLAPAEQRDPHAEADNAEHAAHRHIDALREFDRRQAYRVVSEDRTESDIPETGEVLSSMEALEETLESTNRNLRNVEENKQAMGEKDTVNVVKDFRSKLELFDGRMKSHRYALDTLKIDDWEGGKITPKEFLERFDDYVENMEKLDDMDESLTPDDRKGRNALRESLRADVRHAVEEMANALPGDIPMAKVQREDGTIDDAEVWALYDKTEKSKIIQRISEAAGLDDLKILIHDDVESINTVLSKQDMAEKIMQMEQNLLRDDISRFGDKNGDIPREDLQKLPSDAYSTVMATWTRLNESLGIEWMTAYEWYEAFKEVFESIQELRKQKSRLRISRAATTIGGVLSLVPGLGGKELEHILDEQQTSKNDDIKDSFLKELKNNKIDLGFKQLFGEPGGKTGYLQNYALLGDTNRTRAVIEFAAGKGMLYGLENTDWTSYRFPGGLRVNDVLPKEWSDEQKDTYWGNIMFANTQGMASQEKAGEDYVKGRASLAEYLIPFEGAVNSLSLSFAKGIANKTLSKVKDGETSALMTLIILEAWEKNALFRRYVPAEWLDRIAGDSKQLMIGMIKYDQRQILGGARGGTKFGVDYETNDLSKMVSERPSADKKDTPGRLGPLVAAVRAELIKKDPSVKPIEGDADSEKKFRTLTAQVLACQVVRLPNGSNVSIYSRELRPFHIKYKPDEMRDANVSALGDDFFINQSEITNCTAEVMQYIGKLNSEGFAEPTKARYFFSHIITGYDELYKLANDKKNPQREEFAAALKNYTIKQRANLNQWAERALQSTTAGMKLLTEQHAKQDGRKIVLTLLQYGLISMGVVERLAAVTGAPGKAARQLLEDYQGAGGAAWRTAGSTPDVNRFPRAKRSPVSRSSNATYREWMQAP